jgi:8-oxo-dGTP pyrophosphatase MutT (NUDIX family)
MSAAELAATIVLLRERGGSRAAVEALLLRRPRTLRTFGNLWVFPGGKTDAADASREALACVSERDRIDCARILAAGGDSYAGYAAADALQLWIAACRETFEETGVLFARGAGGGACDAARVAALLGRRAEFKTAASEFFRALQAAGLVLDLRSLVYWSRWITPSAALRVFDTAFFVARLPTGAQVHADAAEASAIRWLDPAGFVARTDDEQFALAPPTAITLLQIGRCCEVPDVCDAILRAGRSRTVAPIQPKLANVADVLWAVFPWDREYEALPGEAASPAAAVLDSDRQLPSRLPTRVEVRRQG